MAAVTEKAFHPVENVEINCARDLTAKPPSLRAVKCSVLAIVGVFDDGRDATPASAVSLRENGEKLKTGRQHKSERGGIMSAIESAAA